jgi:hypothetical protein
MRNHSTSIGEAKRLADDRMAAVGADHQIGADFLRLAVDRCAHADDLAALLDHALSLGIHQQGEARKGPAVARQEIEEVPLRH